MKKRVVVAMSGGVDSSVAAYLLKKLGYEVIGITMCFGLDEKFNRTKHKPSCCGLSGIEDARRVCSCLGIKHYVLNFSKEFKKYVIDNFEKEYLSGRTPNPCIRCNEFVKFGALLDKIKQYGADMLATGHYARIKKGRTYCLRKAKDKTKDQTYFLYRLEDRQLRHILFPLGNLTKQEVRQIAKKARLPVANKPGSQEICFLGDTSYRDYLENKFGDKIKQGNIVDIKGNVLGKHKGVAYYTIGQRRGLNIASGAPMYVLKLDAKKNLVVMGDKKSRLSSGLVAESPIFALAYPKKANLELSAKIRYNQKNIKAQVFVKKRFLEVRFKKPVNSVTPGQAIVFYDRDLVSGGAIIKESI